MTLEIRVPVISTAHIKLETAKYLDDWAKKYSAMSVAKYPEGYFISLLDSMNEFGKAELRIIYHDIPEELMDILLWAYKKDYHWVRLDCNGDVVEELPTFEGEVKL